MAARLSRFDKQRRKVHQIKTPDCILQSGVFCWLIDEASRRVDHRRGQQQRSDQQQADVNDSNKLLR